jgi:hypothetical protein
MSNLLIEEHFILLPRSFLTKRAKATTFLFMSKYHKHEPDIFVASTINILIPCTGMYLDGLPYFYQGKNCYKLK